MAVFAIAGRPCFIREAAMGAGVIEVTPEALRQHMHAAIGRRQAPGVAFACTHGGDPELTLSAGLARIAPASAATPDTAYPWFSVTKLFTATAVLQLAGNGALALDNPISDYLPALPLKGQAMPTVRQLLSHTSGLANPIPVSWVHLADESGPSLDALTARLLSKHPKLSFAPGNRFAYSNLNYLLLGQLIERISGLRYETYLANHVLEPLGARNTSFRVTPAVAFGYSRPWSFMGIAARLMLDRKFFGKTAGGYTELRPFALDGAPYGGLVGPATDMLLLGKAMLCGGGAAILPAEMAEAALAPVKAPGGSPLPVGLGWHAGNAGGEPYAYHLGGGGGFRSELRIYPRLNYAVAVIGNETSFDTGAFTRLVVSGPRR